LAAEPTAGNLQNDPTDCFRRPSRNRQVLDRASSGQGVGRGLVAGRFSIEQAIRESALAPGSVDDAGYRVAYAVAEDNLRLGRDVVGDSVNGWMLTRNAWRDVGLRAGARVVEVEITCTDRDEHRRRVRTRVSEVPGLILPDWQAVIGTDYHSWDRDRVAIDTAGRSIAACVELVLEAI
jgi:hypothetical protein